ncbi:hypothetical protein Tco_0077794 [Tanacetum coccineum]
MGGDVERPGAVLDESVPVGPVSCWDYKALAIVYTQLGIQSCEMPSVICWMASLKLWRGVSDVDHIGGYGMIHNDGDGDNEAYDDDRDDDERENNKVDFVFDENSWVVIFIEEIDLFLTPDDSMPLGIENDDYDSEGDILFLKELLSNYVPFTY